MTPNEKSAIIGHYRNGVDYATIGAIYGISSAYVGMIVREYLDVLVEV